MIVCVTDQGAVGDGRTVNTQSIQRAVDLCHGSGGGTVFFPKGVFVSGTLYLKSNVTLEITAGAVLMASPDIRDYGTDTHHNRYRNEEALDRCFLYAQDQENIDIVGKGEINGNARAFPNEGDENRPMMLRFLRCKNIHIDGVRLYQAAAWTAAFLDSSRIWVSRVQIFNDKNYNGDGLDFDGCAHVFVDGCSITGTDDNLCLQAGSKAYPVKDIHISNCEFSSICAAIRIGLKSIGDIYNVVISNCTMDKVWREGIKIECTEGGTVSDISISNIVMRDVRRPLFVLLNNRFRPEEYGNSIELKEVPKIGRMKNILIHNIIATDSKEMKKTHRRFGDDIMGEPRFNGIRIDAEEHHAIRNVAISHFVYHSIGGVKKSEIPVDYPKVVDQKFHPGEITSENYYPDWSRAAFMDIRNVQGLSLEDIIFSAEEPDEREGYFVENSQVYRREIYVR